MEKGKGPSDHTERINMIVVGGGASRKGKGIARDNAPLSSTSLKIHIGHQIPTKRLGRS